MPVGKFAIASHKIGGKPKSRNSKNKFQVMTHPMLKL